VLEEYNNTGGVRLAYVYGNDLISQTKDNLTTYYLVDGLGSTRLLTDAQGNVLNTYDYDAFGKTINQSGSATNQYLFAGEQFDPGLGDYYLRDRFYNPGVGRFSRADSFQGVSSSPITAHKYLYANNNPINLIDPSGFFAASMIDVSAANILLGALAIYTYAEFNKTITTDYTPEKLGGFGEGERPRTVLEGIFAWRNTWTAPPLGGFQENSGLNVPYHTGHSRDYDDFVEHVFTFDTKDLIKNMEADNRPKVDGYAAHHIVAGQRSYFQDTRDILMANRIDINDAANGVWLNYKVNAGKDYHGNGVHSRKAATAIANRIRGLSSDEIKIQLRKIGEEMKDGTFKF
jgi:RHS repeat-associated protein